MPSALTINSGSLKSRNVIEKVSSKPLPLYCSAVLEGPVWEMELLPLFSGQPSLIGTTLLEPVKGVHMIKIL